VEQAEQFQNEKYSAVNDVFCVFAAGFCFWNRSSLCGISDWCQVAEWNRCTIDCHQEQEKHQPTLVTTYGLKMNMYSNRIQRIVTMDALFEKAL
jgi:hypothetical protein